MKFTGEQYVPGQTDKTIEDEHLSRYEFASRYIKDKIVLDVACGTGYGSKIMSSTAKQVIGVDISDEVIKFAKEHYQNNNLEYFCHDSTSLFFSEHYFDVIISFETIEHLSDSDRELYLKEIWRVLKAGGTFIISTPNKIITSPHSKIPKNKFHITEYTAEDLKKILKDHALNPEKIYGQRQIKKSINNYLAKLFMMATGKFKKTYLEASGPKVEEIKDGFEATYLVIVCKK
ncbi:MAG: methyltransferase domain-containing protein [bacterium]